MNFYADPPSRNGDKISYSSSLQNGTQQQVEKLPNDELINEKEPYRIQIKWKNVFIFIYLHMAAVYGFFLPKQTSTVIIGWIVGILSGMGTTVGAHRLFTHRTFKASQKMKILMVILQTMAGQEPALHWVRDHRVHHKYTDTDADPYNSRRGFFFSHMGWLLCRKHPEVIKQGKKVDMSDLENDPILLLQQKYYVPAAIILTLGLPVALSCYLGESFSSAYNGNIYRYLLGLHLVWSVNSVAHIWGHKPYDKTISPTDSYLVGFLAMGEGWHNYHHIFPWDYKTAELPGYAFNLSTAFIDFFAWLGWATELKTVPADVMKKRILRTGDGSHKFAKVKVDGSDDNNNEDEDDGERDIEHFWGFGDHTMTKQDMKNIKIL